MGMLTLQWCCKRLKLLERKYLFSVKVIKDAFLVSVQLKNDAQRAIVHEASAEILLIKAGFEFSHLNLKAKYISCFELSAHFTVTHQIFKEAQELFDDLCFYLNGPKVQ